MGREASASAAVRDSQSVKFRDRLFWLSRWPRARYLLEENNHDGVDLYRIERRIVRPRGAVQNGWAWRHFSIARP